MIRMKTALPFFGSAVFFAPLTAGNALRGQGGFCFAAAKGERPAGAPFLSARAERSGKRKSTSKGDTPMCPPWQSPRLKQVRGADVRRSALQLHGAAVVGTFPGRDSVRGVGQRKLRGFTRGVATPLVSPEKGNFQGGKPFRERFSLLNASFPTAFLREQKSSAPGGKPARSSGAPSRRALRSETGRSGPVKNRAQKKQNRIFLLSP